MYNVNTEHAKANNYVQSDTTAKGGENMKRADVCNPEREDDVEMMSDGTLKRLIEYLKSIGWSDSQIVALLDYVAGK